MWNGMIEYSYKVPIHIYMLPDSTIWNLRDQLFQYVHEYFKEGYTGRYYRYIMQMNKLLYIICFLVTLAHIQKIWNFLKSSFVHYGEANIVLNWCKYNMHFWIWTKLL